MVKKLLDKIKKVCVIIGFKISRKGTMQLIYLKRFNKFINFKSPKDFREKLHWLKLYGDQNRMADFADKLNVKQILIQMQLGDYIVPTLYQTKKLKQEDFKTLPDSFVIKANHSSGDVVLVKNKEEVNVDSITKKVNKWLKKDYSRLNGETFYSLIDRKILIEPLLKNNLGDVPYDYKVHCFNGVPKYIQVDVDRFTDHKRNFYDTEWNLMSFEILHSNSSKSIDKPDRLQEMLSVSTKVSKAFDYVRIDFYIADKLYIGEVTFIHGSGLEPIYPEQYNLTLGNLIKLGDKNEKL